MFKLPSITLLFLIPDARNFESVDAFRVSPSPIFQRDPGNAPTAPYETLQFQMTVGESQPTKLKDVKNVLEQVRKDLPNTDVTCAVVYVVPDDVQKFYKKPQDMFECGLMGTSVMTTSTVW
jgi:hypothetical protein